MDVSAEVKPLKSWKSFDFIFDPVEAAPTFGQIFCDMFCFLQSGEFLCGIKKVLLDQNRIWGLKLTDPKAQDMVAGIDEVVEVILSFAERNIGWKALLSASKYYEIAHTLSAILKEMSRQIRCVVSDSFRMILEDGAYAKVPGCAELLSANEGFQNIITGKVVKHPVKPATASENQKLESYFPPLPSKAKADEELNSEVEFLDRLEKEEMEVERYQRFGSSSGRVVKAPPPSKSSKKVNDETWQQQIAELKQANMKARNAFQTSKDPKSALEAAAAEAISHVKEAARPQSSKVNSTSKVSVENSFLGSESEAEDDDSSDIQPCKKRKESHNGFLMLAAKLGLNSSIQDKKSSSSTEPASKNGAVTKRTYSELYRMALNRDEVPGGGMSSFSSRTVAETLMDVSADSLLMEVLRLDLHAVCEQAEVQGRPTDKEFEKAPIRFIDEDQYISKFEPLLVDEVKAALVSQIMQWRTSPSGGTHKMRYNNHSSSGGSKGSFDREFTVSTMKCTGTVIRPSCKDIAEVQLRPVHQSQFKAHFVKDDLILIPHSMLPKG